MADEETQAREESLWWASDASSDPQLPIATFDEPLEWPDALPWEEFDAGEPGGEGFGDPEHLSIDMLFPPADAMTAVEAEQPLQAGQPAESGDPADPGLHPEPLPESIWAPEPASDDDPPAPAAAAIGGLGGAPTAVGWDDADWGREARTVAVPPFYAKAEANGAGRWSSWLAVLRGNAAVVALISFVSLVLLGMFLSVRARNDVPTDTSRSTAPQADIAATRPLNTIPPTTATTAAPPSTINLSELVPPAEPAADTGGAGGTSAGTTPRTTAPVTTVPRSAAPAGGGGGSATQPTTATTAAAEPPPDTTPPATSPSNDGTTQTTRRSTTTSADVPRPTFTLPSTSIPWPNVAWPTGRDSNNN